MLRHSILVVDDAVNLTLLYEQELEDDGYEVDIANSASTAVRLMDKKSYDLVIVETMMSEIDEIRNFKLTNSHLQETPVVINTRNPNFGDGRTVWGASTCILKSSDIFQLKEKIGLLLEL